MWPRSSGIDFGFVDEENWNIVPHRVNPPALTALKAVVIWTDRQRLLTGWANKYVEQVLGNHGGIVLQGSKLGVVL